MKSKFLTVLIRIASIFLFAVMLCFPSETLSGASTGLLLWFQTVLPTLLPCMILADFLLRIGADRYLTRILSRPLSLLFGVSKEGSYGVLVGLLCGYPMGAKTAASLVNEQRITPQEANYLLSFTNQPSPMFLIGYLCINLFFRQTHALQEQSTGSLLIEPEHQLVGLILVSIYGSTLMVSVLYRIIRRMHHRLLQGWNTGSPVSSNAVRSRPSGQNKSADSSPLSLLESSMMTSFEVMVKIGGYMMLFSIGEALIWKLPGLNPLIKCCLMGFVEMTTGSRHIVEGINIPWSVILCAGFTAFGGLSGLAQTANVLKGSGLPAGHYFLWKLMQGCLAAVMVLLWFFFIGRYPALS